MHSRHLNARAGHVVGYPFACRRVQQLDLHHVRSDVSMLQCAQMCRLRLLAGRCMKLGGEDTADEIMSCRAVPKVYSSVQCDACLFVS